MMNWRHELRLEGQAETSIDVSGRNSFAEADSHFCGTIMAMAGHDLRQPLGIEFRVVPADTTVFSHSVLLKGLVRNLIRNAIDYTPPGGRVLVGCRRRRSQVHLQVRDSGVGIPGDELGRVFKPFYRLDITRPEGLGLGLFIVKHTAGCLRHDVQVYSVVGRGSGFAVVIDAAPPTVSMTAA